MKIRALSPNVINMVRRRRLRDLPVFWWIHSKYINLRSSILNIVRRRKNIVHMKALKRSQWADCDTRLFEAGFQILVDYVEGELAWMQLLNEGNVRWYHRWFSISNARELGIRMLEWDIQLGDDSITQSEAAHEIKDLYLWYKDVRPQRIEPYDEVPDRPMVLEENEDGEMYLPSRHDDKEFVDAVAAAAKAEEAYDEEDTEQLIRIMRVRRSMWT